MYNFVTYVTRQNYTLPTENNILSTLINKPMSSNNEPHKLF